MNSYEKQCLEYFKSYDIYHVLLEKFRDKYDSYSGFSGKVILNNVKEADIECLEGFMGKNYHGQRSITISAKAFEKALKESRFDRISPKCLLELYFQEEITGKRERKIEKQGIFEKLFSNMINRVYQKFSAENTKNLEDCLKWIEDIKIKTALTADVNDIGELLEIGTMIIENLPVHHREYNYLAIFSAKTTGNPHFFDEGTKGGLVLKQIVDWYDEHEYQHTNSKIFNSIERQRKYLNVGILIDDVSNYAIFSGIHAIKKNGEVHHGIEGFFEEKDMFQLPLSVLVTLDKIICPNQEIYIVENPSVFSMMCQKYKGERACMCMNGQPRLSGLIALDLLCKSGTMIHYSGDFDPEGLCIAQKLRHYYEGEFIYWHMNQKDYLKSIAIENHLNQEMLSQRRMKMLDQIVDEELFNVVELIRKYQKAGYQENVF